ncbi:mucin-17-like [Dorcoceras hygrometricum]|uniref:Mucin-17-like n=1 Tax=Dorcoceras hygrometricum TaxID=472368 RepID=A0A2Z7C198_9LAMI|nr:mucin-17-like [Dorcoceras hygrometricum]
MVASEIDEDLAIFLKKQAGEKGRHDHSLALESDESDESSGASPDADRLDLDPLRFQKIHCTPEDSFLKLEAECDWLPKELDTSPVPSVKESKQDSAATQAKSSNGEAIFLKSEASTLPNSCRESTSLCKKSVPRPTTKGVNSSLTAKTIPLTGGRNATPTSATPTGRTSLPAKSKSFHPSTTTLKVTKPVAAQGRSVTPARLVSINSKSSTRSATPTLEPSTRAMTSSASDQFSSARKTNPVTSHGTSPSLKTKTSKPSAMHTPSHDTPQNSKTLMPIREVSASRRRPSVPCTISLNAKSGQKAYISRERSPSRTRHKSERLMLTRNRSRDTNGGDEVNPVLMGSKMVERVVSMRKLAPPKQTEYSSQDYPQKSFSSSGFGRSLSKKSLDMALRHMLTLDRILDGVFCDLPSLVGTKSCSSKNSTVDVTESLASSRY